MRVLITGASGFIGSTLAPRMHHEGHEVRALGRDPARVAAALAPSPQAREPAAVGARGDGARAGPIEILAGDALTGAGLKEALHDVEVAYYLIHSMESRARAGAGRGARNGARHAGPPGTSFSERERLAAGVFARAARSAGVRRIVYLGGLTGSAGAPASRHLASRLEVEEILLGEVEDSLALRASIVIGARSRSFRLLVRLVERMPVLALPAWRDFRTEPVDGRDVIEMLVAAASAPLGGRSLDAVGPEVLSYGEMLARIAELMLLDRPAVGLTVNLTPVTARVAAAIAGEDPELIVALMEGLEGDLLSRGARAGELFGVQLHSFDAAVERALREWERSEPLRAR